MNPKRKYNKDLIPLSQELRKNMTPAEKHLWYDFLQNHPKQFLRQKVLGKYIADFYCAEAKLVIEVDGKQHYTEDGLENDAQRTEFLKHYGITVIRFKNYQVRDKFKWVCERIDETLVQLTEEDQEK